MQIGEEDLAAAQLLALGGERLLDLHDHVGAGEDLLAACRRASRPAATYSSSARPATDAGRSLDQNLMAVMDELGHRGGRQADAKFVVLDFLGHADEHGEPPPFDDRIIP